MAAPSRQIKRLQSDNAELREMIAEIHDMLRRLLAAQNISVSDVEATGESKPVKKAASKKASK